MTGWVIFQLILDIIIFSLVIVFVLRDSKTKNNAPNISELRLLVQEFKDAVEKSEKVARDLDAQLRGRKEMMGGSRTQTTGVALKEHVEAKAVVKGGGAPTGDSPTLETIEEHKRNVATLYRQGMPKDEISKRLAISLPEVELIVAMLSIND